MVSLHVLISGRVQGVWFRKSVKLQAIRLGLSGWVRNTKSSCVEAVFEGPREKVNKMLAWCKRGPPLAKVDSVKVSPAATDNLSGFEIIY